METKFIAKNKAKSKSIYYCFNYPSINNKRTKLVLFSGYNCGVNEWGNGMLKQINTTKEIRNILTTNKQKIDNYIKTTQLEKERLPTQSELKEFIYRLQNGKQEDKIYVKDLITSYIEWCENVAKHKKSTLRKKKHNLNDLSIILGKKQIVEVTTTLIRNYNNHVQKKQGEITYKNDYIKNAKSFFRWLYVNEFTTVNYADFLHKQKEIKKEIIALTSEELSLLSAATLPPKLQKVVDLFLFSCYSGLRFCDVQTLDKQHITNNTINFRVQKTSELITIPLNDVTSSILIKYNYQLPKISNQKANKYLKQAFKLLNMNRLVRITTTTNNKIKDILLPLHDIISFHKGRKTFVTNALACGIPAFLVKKISGHKSDAIFSQYISYNEQLANEMSKLNTTNLKAI